MERVGLFRTSALTVSFGLCIWMLWSVVGLLGLYPSQYFQNDDDLIGLGGLLLLMPPLLSLFVLQRVYPPESSSHRFRWWVLGAITGGHVLIYFGYSFLA